MVMGAQVLSEMQQGVMTELLFADDNVISFEILIRFVMGKVKFILFQRNVDGISIDNFVPIADIFIIRKS
jgi:hypothetical protein